MPALFTVTGGRIELALNRAYSFGRGTDCDVRVDDVTSSRRHALLRLGSLRSVATVEDLGSRNGTYVNERRVAGAERLQDGDRIRIGSVVYLLRLVDDAAAGTVDVDTATVGQEQLALGDNARYSTVLQVVQSAGRLESFAGQLGSFGLLEVLQVLVRTGRSGTLHLALPSGDATVEVRRGEMVHAEFQDARGLAALDALAWEDSGLFWLIERGGPCVRTINEPSERLLVEMCLRME